MNCRAKKKTIKIKAALLRGSQKAVAWDPGKRFNGGLVVIDLHVKWVERLTVSQPTSAATFGKQERGIFGRRKQDSHQIGRASQMGAVSQRLLVKVNDHDVHFACQTRRRREIKMQRFRNFALMCLTQKTLESVELVIWTCWNILCIFLFF